MAIKTVGFRYVIKSLCMKRIVVFIVCFVGLCSMQAKGQSVGAAEVEMYRQILNWTGQDFEQCSTQLAQWGYVYNKANIINMFTMVINPFVHMDENDTLGVMLATIDNVVYSVSGLYSSVVPARTFSLLVKAGELQHQIATERGLTNYSCMVKGDVKNKRPKNHEELVEMLAEASSETVRSIYEFWKSNDGKQSLTLSYDNKRYGKKSPRADACAELSIGLGMTP